MINFLLSTFSQIFTIIILLLIAIAFATLLERKILGSIQRRQGPNVIGSFGLLQPLADGLKLFSKEIIIPSNANKYVFIVAPVLSFFVSLLGWAVIPFDDLAAFSNISLGLLYILSVSSLGVYGIILSGWSSNSKYAFLGALRSTAQMISYELPIGFTMLTVVICCGSFNLNDVIYAQRHIWHCFPLGIPAIIFFICGLAETNRHPFDLPEAESELVSGYNVEYSGMPFALFSLAEYSNILLMCCLNSILFWGGWYAPLSILSFLLPGPFWLSIKICLFYSFFVYARAILPRYRYDELMRLGWKVLLPMSFGYLILTIFILYIFGIYPQ